MLVERNTNNRLARTVVIDFDAMPAIDRSLLVVKLVPSPFAYPALLEVVSAVADARPDHFEPCER